MSSPSGFARNLEEAEKGGGDKLRKESHEDPTPKEAVKATEKKATTNSIASPYSKYIAPDARIWALYLEEAEAEDKELMEPWNKNLDSLLVFAGLFAAILTAFLIESRKELYDDPQTRLLQDILGTMRNTSYIPSSQVFEPGSSFININFLWFTSLTLTLTSALGGVLSKGWIAKQSSSSVRKTSNDAYSRHLRASRMRQWRVGMIISIVSLLIQIALFLFFAGLVIILWDVQNIIKFTILALVCAASLLYLIITIMPWIFPACPLQTPITEGTPWIQKPIIYGKRGGMIGSSKDTGENIWRRSVSLYRTLRSVPEAEELQAQIIAWIISNTLDERVMKEALRALAGAQWTQVMVDTLSESGSFGILNMRLPQYLTQARLNGNEEEWTCILLYLMWHLEQMNMDKKPAGSSFRLLLSEGGPLHRWEAFQLSEQPLACSLRLYILMNCEMDDPDEDWQESIHGLIKVVNDQPTTSMRELLFSAASRGIHEGKDNIQRMSSVITADLLLSIDIEALSNQLEGSNREGLESNWARNFKQMPYVLCSLSLDNDSGVREAAIEALLKMAEDDQLCIEFGKAFEKLAVTRNRDQLPSILAVIAAVAQNSKLRTSMSGGAKLIMQGSKNELNDCWTGVVHAIISLMHHGVAKFDIEELILNFAIIPHSVPNARDIAISAMRTFGVQEAWRSQIKASIQKATDLLIHSDDEVQRCALHVIIGFSTQSEFQSDVKAAVPKIIDLLSERRRLNMYEEAVFAMVTLGTRSEYQSEIKASIPKIVKLLESEYFSILECALDAVRSLVTQDEFKSEFRASIPMIIKLLDFNMYSVQSLALEAINSFITQAAFLSDIKLAAPIIIYKMASANADVRRSALKTIGSLGAHRKFKSEVKSAIQEVIRLLSDTERDVRTSALDTVKALGTHADFQSAFKVAIPKVIELLADMYEEARNNARDTIRRFGAQAAIFKIIELIEDNTGNNRMYATHVIMDATMQTQFRSEINTALPKIILLLKHRDKDTLSSALQAIENLGTQDEFKPVIKTAMPLVIELLGHQDSYIRYSACWKLETLGAQAEFQSDIRAAIPTLIEILSHSDKSIQIDALKGIAVLGVHTEFQSNIKVAIPKLFEILIHCDDKEVSARTLTAIKSLGVQREIPAEFISAIPKLFEILKSSTQIVQINALTAVGSLGAPIELQPNVKAMIPKVVECLVDSDINVKMSAMEAIGSLAAQTDFQLDLKTAVSHVIELLVDSDDGVKINALEVVKNLVTQAEFHSNIKSAIPTVTKLLAHSDNSISKKALEVIEVLGRQAEFQLDIKIAIPRVIETLAHESSWVRGGAKDAMKTLAMQSPLQAHIVKLIPNILQIITSQHGDFQTAMETIKNIARYLQSSSGLDSSVSILINWLNEHDSALRKHAITITLVFLTIDGSYEQMARAVKVILTWLTFRNHQLRVDALKVINYLIKYNQCHSEIQECSRQIIGLLGDHHPAVRITCVRLFCSSKCYGVLGSKVKDFIPRVTELLADIDRDVRSAAVKALRCVIHDERWRPAIEQSWADYRFLLENKDMESLHDSPSEPLQHHEEETHQAAEPTNNFNWE